MSALDSAIAQHLQTLKAQNPGLSRLQAGHAPTGAPGFPGTLPVQAVAGPPPMGAQLAQLQPQPPGVPGVQPAMGPGGPAPAAPAGPALLSVAINNLPFRYVLAEADLREMCQRWGQVVGAQVYREGTREVGVITFADPIDAADCQRQIDGHPSSFQGAQGALVAVLGSPEQLSPPLPRQPGGMPMPGTLPTATPGTAPPGMSMGGPGQMPPMGMPMGAPGPGGGAPMMALNAGPSGAMPKSAPSAMEAMMGKGKGKPMNGKGTDWPGNWTCTVIVKAENMHPDFPTAAKIVGNGSANVEHIRSQANCDVELRGLKSGTMEPSTGQELQQPMFISLESASAQSGLAALEMVKDLLTSVYDEHQNWCRTHNLRLGEGLEPVISIQDPNSAAAPVGPSGAEPSWL